MYDFIALRSFIDALYKNVPLTVVPYGYTVTASALAQNAVQSVQLGITANADFVLTGFRYRAQIGAAQTTNTKTAAFVRMQVTDSGSNENFWNSAVDLENICQNGVGDRTIATPRWIGGRSALTFQFTNYAPTAETYTTIDVFLDGVLVRTL